MMNKLNKVLVALLALGMFAAAEAKRCGTKSCSKPKCEKKCEKVCKPEVQETCVERLEQCEGEECVTVKRPVIYQRKCYDKTRCVTTQACDKKGWQVVKKGAACVDEETFELKDDCNSRCNN